MKIVSASSPHFSRIEPLESRIAPARMILVGAPDAPNKADTNYGDAAANDGGAGFVNTETGGDMISAAVGPGVVGSADTFYLKLGAGDVLNLFTSQNASSPLLKVTSGNVVAFFIDGYNGSPQDNEVQQNELVSLALGKDTAIELRSGVAGDILTNLNEHNTKDTADDTLDMTDLVSAKQGIKSLFIGGGGVTGNVFSGGNISNVTVNGGINSILTGSAAFNKTFDFFPTVNGGNGTLSGSAGVQPAAGELGPSISNVTLNDDLVDRIQAGDGGAGAAGGSLSKFVISKDTTGFLLQAGKGGDGTLAKKNGGNGGTVTGVYVAGVNEDPANPTPNDLIHVLAGAGGTSAMALGGKGGTGGALSQVYVGFQFIGGKPLPSAQVLADDVSVASGAGGAGKTGGNGGGVTSVNVTVSTADAAGDEITVISGAGGDANVAAGGKTGAGGEIKTVDLRNISFTSGAGVTPGLNASIMLHAGNGGTAAGAATGSKGGGITTATLLGSDHTITAGNGSSGKTGGDGGALKTISFIQGDSVLVHKINMAAGLGGSGSAGKGGKGGDTSGVSVINSDLSAFVLNAGTGANGGTGTGNKGGNGGLVSGIDVVDFDSGSSLEGSFSIRSGSGGSGSAGSGNGGAISTVTLDAVDLNVTVASGSGGSILVGGKGTGGLGGSLTGVNVASAGTVAGGEVAATITSGTGGNGMGTAGKGGAGGNLTSVSATVFGDVNAAVANQGNVTITGGNGGNGDGGNSGNGGNLAAVGGFSERGSGVLQAGNAGTNGAKAGIGGNIFGSSADRLSGIYALHQIDIHAGNGSNGGAGGSVKLVGYGSTSTGAVTEPDGNINVTAGNGSANAVAAGKGGLVDNLTGSVSSGGGVATTTLIRAGVGGGSSTRVADGGSISNLTISTGGAPVGSPTVELLIEAGDAGDGGTAVSTGAKGGSVSAVTVSDLTVNTNLRHISAGDGGDAGRKGGIGGSITNVQVLDHDIGIRQGLSFGYTSMGGLFAGAGGAALAAGGVKGLAGNVSKVSATAIAAIVAGHGSVPLQVELVDFITVGIPTDLLRASEGDIDFSAANDTADANDPMNHYHPFVAASYATNNLVGAVVNPTATDGTRFHFNDANSNGLYDVGETPIDGLILAKNINTANLNFTAEARFAETLNGKISENPITQKFGGTTVVNEQQEFSAFTSGSTYKLSFGKQQTAFLPVGATSGDVANALNGLATIAAAGGVTVTSSDVGALRTFTIKFNTVGDKTAISLLPHPFYDYDNLV